MSVAGDYAATADGEAEASLVVVAAQPDLRQDRRQ